MPLPFLIKKHKDAAQPSVQVEHRKPDEEPDGDTEYLKSCAQDLIDAVHSGDSARVAESLKDIFELLDSRPHSEGPHTQGEE